MSRVYRTEALDVIAHDDRPMPPPIPDDCPWCGDALKDGKCARRCERSRVVRMDGDA